MTDDTPLPFDLSAVRRKKLTVQLNKLLSLQSVPCNRGAYFGIESHRGCLNDRDTTLDAERRSSLQGILKPPSPATSPALQGVRPG
jgi:hypothetical protein